MRTTIPGVSPGLQWLNAMMSFLDAQSITMPSDYRNKVLAVKELLQNDESGLINAILDLSISAATDVDFSIETDNANLTAFLSNWMDNINSELRGRIPTGLEPLAKEYYRERWKGSSFLVLRTFWEKVDGYNMPTKLYFVDGEDIVVKYNKDTVRLGDETYHLRVSPKKTIPIGTKDNEILFVQKPYESWGSVETTPYLMQRGIYKNAKILSLIIDKGANVVAKALEYMMIVKKGTESLAKEGRSEFIYDDKDLLNVKKKLGVLFEESRSNGGTPAHVTNFDTDITHLIPEYENILKATLTAPAEKRILAGLGMVDIVDSAGGSSRRESTLNPKPLMEETNSGVFDFSLLMKDVLVTIAEKNKNSHRKQFSNSKVLRLRTTPVSIFKTKDENELFRGLYDRGLISKESMVEIIGDLDYFVEKTRRKEETKNNDDETMFCPIIQNNGDNSEDEGNPSLEKIEKTDDDKKGPEKTKYKSANKDVVPYEGIKDLPETVKNTLPKKAQEIYFEVFNQVLEESGEKDIAIEKAWSIVKTQYKKDKPADKWKKIKKADLEGVLEKASVDDLERIQKLALLGKQHKLIDKFLAENSEEGDK